MTIDKLAYAIIGDNWNASIVMTVAPDLAAKRVRDAFVVIDRADLPEVKTSRRVLYTVVHRDLAPSVSAEATPEFPGAPNADPDWHEAKAKAHLAMAEHLRANPPVDEQAVAELSELLDGFYVVASDAQSIARRLVADGWTKLGGSA